MVPALGSAVVSCDDRQLNPDSGDPRISVSANMTSETKAVLGQLDGSAQVKLFDVLPSVSYEKRIDGAVVSHTSGSDKWTIQNEPTGGYSWLKGGTGTDKTSRVDHNFFAWLSKDNDGLTDADLFGSALSLTNSSTHGVYTVSVPETEMLLTSTQFDFSYSGIVRRLAKDADYSRVDIPLNHFFSCFNLKVHNYTATSITITAVELYGLTNRKSGFITYNVNDGTATASYTAASSESKTWTSSSPTSLFSGSRIIDADSEELLSADHLMWPQTAQELDDAFLVVTYKSGSSVLTSDPICIKPENSSAGWDAGSRHEIELAFTDKEFKLTVKALPWDLYQQSIDYSGGVSVKETGMMTFKEGFCTVDETNRRVYFKNGNPITIYFTIDAPLDATWQISKKGDWDYFELDNSAYTSHADPEHDSNYGTIDGKTSTVTLYPKGIGSHKIQLSFSVRTNDGREINIDELIQGPQKYTFISE